MFKSIFSASIAAILLTAAAFGQAGQSWQKFASAEGQFEVSFPYRHTTKKKLVETAVGPAKMTSFLAASTSGDAAFLAAYADYSVDITDPLEALKRSEKGSLDASNGTLISSSAATFMGHPARVFKVRVDPPGGGRQIATVKYVLVGRRLYQLIVVRSENEAAAPENARFISSFRLVLPANVARR